MITSKMKKSNMFLYFAAIDMTIPTKDERWRLTDPTEQTTQSVEMSALPGEFSQCT